MHPELKLRLTGTAPPLMRSAFHEHFHPERAIEIYRCTSKTLVTSTEYEVITGIEWDVTHQQQGGCFNFYPPADVQVEARREQ